MKSLIEEFGHTIVALIVASVMLLFVLFGTVVPYFQTSVKSSIPEDTPGNKTAFSESFNRAEPVIATPLRITLGAGTTSLDFNTYIADRIIKATNADGEDISSNIIIKAADDNTAMYFDEKTFIFSGDSLPAGSYNFTAFVVDCTDTEFFGKVSQKDFVVVVS